jgi:hypothetical protein
MWQRLRSLRRRTRFLVLAAAAVALTMTANAVPVARMAPLLTSTGAVVILAQVIGGLALGYAVLAVGDDKSMRAYRGWSVVSFAGLGLIFGALGAESLWMRPVLGIQVALIFSLIGLVISPVWGRFLRWHDRMSDEAEEEQQEAMAAHEALVTPVMLPTWNRRLVARLIDTILAVGVIVLVLVSLGRPIAPTLFVVAAILWPLYDIPLHASVGATAGKALCRIRVVHAGGADHVGVLRATGRWVLVVMNLPFIVLQTRVTGDLLWAIDPRLSVMKPVSCGTLLTTAAEGRRLASLAPSVRDEQLTETFQAVRAIPPPVPRRTALIALPVIVVCCGFGAWLAIVTGD